MISNDFQLLDYTERLYSYSNQKRFYQVLAKHPQLQRVLLNKHSLQLLQKQSKQYKNMITATLGGSLLLLYPFNKFVKFGPGVLPGTIKIICNFIILFTPTIFVSLQMKKRMIETKNKAFEQNRSNFRKYELTGDVLQISERFQLAQE